MLKGIRSWGELGIGILSVLLSVGGEVKRKEKQKCSEAPIYVKSTPHPSQDCSSRTTETCNRKSTGGTKKKEPAHVWTQTEVGTLVIVYKY
jgi:hypothetical protein